MTKQDRTAWMLASALFLALFFIWGVAYDCFPILLPSVLKQFHLTREQIGKVPAAQALAALIVSPMVGWLLDRIPARELRAAFRDRGDGFGVLDFKVTGTTAAPRTDLTARLGKAAAGEAAESGLRKLFGHKKIF